MLGGVLVGEQLRLSSEDMGVTSSQELASMDIAPSSHQSSSNADASHSSVTDKVQTSQILVNNLPVSLQEENSSHVHLIRLDHHEEPANCCIHLHSNDPPDVLPHTPSSLSTASTLPSVDVALDTPTSEGKDFPIAEQSALERGIVRNSIGHPVSVKINSAASTSSLSSSAVPSVSSGPNPSFSASSTPIFEESSVIAVNSVSSAVASSTLAPFNSTAADDVLCDVCFGGECEEGNQILLCDGCDKGVHQACYGIAIIPEGKWFCSVCEWKKKQLRFSEEHRASNSKEKPVRCKLCDHEDGIMRRSIEKVWVHSSCVLFASTGPFFRKKVELDDPCGITQSLKEARSCGYRCDICNYVGFPLPCAYPQCSKRIHVTCAKEAGCFCFLEHIWEGEGAQRRDTVWKAVFCREHSVNGYADSARQVEKRRLLPCLGYKEDAVASTDILTSRRQHPRAPIFEMAHRKSPLFTPTPVFPSTSTACTSHRRDNKSRAGCTSTSGGCTLPGETQTTSHALGSYDPTVMDVGTAAHTQIHAAPTRGVRVNWLRYENWFKRVAIGPYAEQILASIPLTIRKTSMEEAKQIEEILTQSTPPPSLHQLLLPPDSDLAVLTEITNAYETFLKPRASVETNNGSTSMEFRVPPIAILDFGATAVWAQLKVSSVSMETTLQEQEAANMFLEEWNRHDATWDVLRSVNALPPLEDHQRVTATAPLPLRRQLRHMESVSSEGDMGCSQSSKDGISNDEEDEDEEEIGKHNFDGNTPLISLYNQPSAKKHLSVRFGAFVRLSLFQMLYIRKKLATISVIPHATPYPSLPPRVTCTFSEAMAPSLSSSRQQFPGSRCHNLSVSYSSHTEAPTVLLGGIYWHRPQRELMDEAAVQELVSGSDDFVGAQLAMLVTFSRSCNAKLSVMRGNLLDILLEENVAPLRVIEMGSRLQQQLARYSAMNRWSHVCSSLVAGLTDKPESALSLKKTMRSGNALHSSQGIASVPVKVEGEEDAHRVYCSVCFGEEGLAIYQIFTCCRCQMSVHKGCYAIGKPGEEIDATEWLCKRCEVEKKSLGTQWQITFTPGSALCDICGIWGGAFKRTVTNTWVHLLCALWLMPETQCNDLEQLEPWSLANIQPWRRSSRCFLCGSEWGYCVSCSYRCGGGRCAFTFHPMCAWLQGLYVQASKTRDDFLEWQGTVDFCFPKLIIDVYCSKHIPAAVKERNPMMQMDIRMHRCSNRDRKPEAYSHKERRDKKKYARGNRGSISKEFTFSAHLPIEEESVCIEVADQYRKDICAVCLLAEGNEEDNSLLHCSKCGLCVHRLCYGYANTPAALSQPAEVASTSNTTDFFQCDVCLRGQDPTLVYCRLCPRKGGALKLCASSDGMHRSPSGVGRFGFSYPPKLLFAHMTCCLWAPNIEISDNDQMSPILGVESVPKLYRLCEVCGLSYGFCLECSQRGCLAFFHPLCAQLKGYFLEMSDDCITGFHSMAFCEKHSQIRQKISPSVRLFLKLRAFLEFAQIIVDQLRKRERIKHMWLRKRKEILNREYPLLDEEELRSLSKENVSDNADVYSCMLAKRLKRSEEENVNSSILEALTSSFDCNEQPLPNFSPTSSIESLGLQLPSESPILEVYPHGEDSNGNTAFFDSSFSSTPPTGATITSLPIGCNTSADATTEGFSSAKKSVSPSAVHFPASLVSHKEMQVQTTVTSASQVSMGISTSSDLAVSSDATSPDSNMRLLLPLSTFARPSLPVRKSRFFVPAWARRDETRRRSQISSVSINTFSAPSTLHTKIDKKGEDSICPGIRSSLPMPFEGKDNAIGPHPCSHPSSAATEENASMEEAFSPSIGSFSHPFAMNYRKKLENFIPTHLSAEELQDLVMKTCQNLPEVSKRGRGRPSRKMKICWLLRNGNRAEAEQYARSFGRTFEDILTSVDSAKFFPRNSPDFDSMGEIGAISPLCSPTRQGGTLPSETTPLSSFEQSNSQDSTFQQTFLPSAALSSISIDENTHPTLRAVFEEYSLLPAASFPAVSYDPSKEAAASSNPMLSVTSDSPTIDVSCTKQQQHCRDDNNVTSRGGSNGINFLELSQNFVNYHDVSSPHYFQGLETESKRKCNLSTKRQPKVSDIVTTQQVSVPSVSVSSTDPLSATDSPIIPTDETLPRRENCSPLLARISEMQKLGSFYDAAGASVPTSICNSSSLAKETFATSGSSSLIVDKIVPLLNRNDASRSSQKKRFCSPKGASSNNSKLKKRQSSQLSLKEPSTSSLLGFSVPPAKRRNLSTSAKSEFGNHGANALLQPAGGTCASFFNENYSTLFSDASVRGSCVENIVDASSTPTTSSEARNDSSKDTAEVLLADIGCASLHGSVILDPAGIVTTSTQSSPDLLNKARLCAPFRKEGEPMSALSTTTAPPDPNDFLPNISTNVSSEPSIRAMPDGDDNNFLTKCHGFTSDKK